VDVVDSSVFSSLGGAWSLRAILSSSQLQPELLIGRFIGERYVAFMWSANSMSIWCDQLL
jgi:hypothetical protein